MHACKNSSKFFADITQISIRVVKFFSKIRGPITILIAYSVFAITFAATHVKFNKPRICNLNDILLSSERDNEIPYHVTPVVTHSRPRLAFPQEVTLLEQPRARYRPFGSVQHFLASSLPRRNSIIHSVVTPFIFLAKRGDAFEMIRDRADPALFRVEIYFRRG